MSTTPRRTLISALLLASLALAGCSDDESRAAEHLERAAGFIAADDPRSAIIELKSALRLRPEDADARARLGRIYLEQGLGTDAVKELRRARELGAGEPGLDLALGQALVLAREYEDALAHIARHGGKDAGWQTLRGDALLGLQRVPEAAEAFRSALDEDPDNPAALRGAARSSMLAGEAETAREHLGKALEGGGTEVETLLLKGELEHSLGDFAASEASYARALELSGEQPVARLGLVRALLAQQKTAAAREHLAALERANVRTPLLDYLKAVEARLNNDLGAATQSLREVLKVAPDHASSLLLMGQINLMQRELDQALSVLTRYVGLVPGNPAGRKLLAAVELELNQPRDAIRTLEPLAGGDADDAQVLSLLGTAYMKLGELDRGRELLDRASRTAPGTAAIRTQLAVSHLAQGDTEKAAEELQTVIDQDPEFARADFLLVLTRLREGNVDAALAAARNLVDKHPDSAEAHNLLGAVHEANQDPGAARSSYERSMELSPNSRAGPLNLARLDLRDGARDAARQRFQAVADRHPDDATALLGLARIASDEGKTDESLRLLERARSANPGAVRPRLVLANYHLRSGRPDEALLILEEARAAAPDAPAVGLLLGRAELAAGRPEDAVQTLSELTRRTPEAAISHFTLALAQRAAGDHDAARDSLLRTLELEPANHLARATLGQVEIARGQYDEALALAERLAQDAPDVPAGAVLRGDVANARGERDAAVKAYRAAWEKARNSALLVKLFVAEQRAGLADDARRRAEAWLREHPRDSRVRSLLAASMHESGDPGKVIEHYQTVLETDPRNVVALNNLAWLYYQRGDERFLGLAKEAYDLMPQRPEVMDTYGWLLVESGQVERGLELINRAHEAAPANRDIGYHRAAALHRAGDRSRARRLLEDLLADGAAFSERDAAKALLDSLPAN